MTYPRLEQFCLTLISLWTLALFLSYLLFLAADWVLYTSAANPNCLIDVLSSLFFILLVIAPAVLIFVSLKFVEERHQRIVSLTQSSRLLDF